MIKTTYNCVKKGKEFIIYKQICIFNKWRFDIVKETFNAETEKEAAMNRYYEIYK